MRLPMLLTSVIAGLGVLIAATPAQAVFRGSVTVNHNASVPFSLSARDGCEVIRDVIVKVPGDRSLFTLDGVIALADGKQRGKVVGDLTWSRASGRSGSNWDEIGTDWALDKGAVKRGQKVVYQVTAILESEDGRYRVVSSSWYPTTISKKC